MSENRFLIQAFDFLARSPIFEEESIGTWFTLLNRLYEQGRLYGCFKGDDLMAVAGLCRISNWDDQYFEELPKNDSGTRLYIPIFVSQTNRIMDPIRLLRDYLKQNPEINEILFHEKYRRRSEQILSRRIRRRRVIRIHQNRFDSSQAYSLRLGVLPPALVNLKEAEEKALYTGCV